jgi:hypothetical protein
MLSSLYSKFKDFNPQSLIQNVLLDNNLLKDMEKEIQNNTK